MFEAFGSNFNVVFRISVVLEGAAWVRMTKTAPISKGEKELVKYVDRNGSNGLAEAATEYALKATWTRGTVSNSDRASGVPIQSMNSTVF